MDPSDISRKGITVLSQGVDPLADIVFIHGLEGHPVDTWVGRNSTTDAPIFWPKDLLARDFPHVRVLSYGHDFCIATFSRQFGGSKGPINHERIDIVRHGQILLDRLYSYRLDCPRRPIIFVAYSLGGIILKQAICEAKNSVKFHRDIHKSTRGIVFFGTPHRENEFKTLGMVVKDIIIATTFTPEDTPTSTYRDNALNRMSSDASSIHPDEVSLKRASVDFYQMLPNDFPTYSFLETEKSKLDASRSQLVVDNISGCFSEYAPAYSGHEYLDSVNHLGMCKFTGEDDSNYQKVERVISRYIYEEVELVPASYTSTSQPQEAPTREMIQHKILESHVLYYVSGAIGFVENAHEGTFEWVFTNSETHFTNWLHGVDGLFWIEGKAGSGKSTLMKFLYDDPRTRRGLTNGLLVIHSFFFNSKISDANNSFRALLLSFIYQLLETVPRFADTSDTLLHITFMNEPTSKWSIELLKKILDSILLLFRDICVCLFVDALDEAVDEAEEIAQFLKDLATPPKVARSVVVRVCVSSRSWPGLSYILGDCPHLRLQDCTRYDITKYAQDRISALHEFDGSQMEMMVDTIVNGAEGSFLLAKLGLQEVEDLIIDGQSLSEIHHYLQGFPMNAVNKLHKDVVKGKTAISRELPPARETPRPRSTTPTFTTDMRTINRKSGQIIPVELRFDSGSRYNWISPSLAKSLEWPIIDVAADWWFKDSNSDTSPPAGEVGLPLTGHSPKSLFIKCFTTSHSIPLVGIVVGTNFIQRHGRFGLADSFGIGYSDPNAEHAPGILVGTKFMQASASSAYQTPLA
ncbi:hypothetical protein BT63DRAFT_468603 [Microthyrium microscopicum]|uniref:Nephrocystin 3-like N-terminal domain-containing protein n=1 Tax=Microthyrium microscopicum TaxID=703497 RepID=A0A6A6UIU4_9PEZI|nr:hypothetical protein BT63DRAFT_468603 [Microthyrium microscopicum]